MVQHRLKIEFLWPEPHYPLHIWIHIFHLAGSGVEDYIKTIAKVEYVHIFLDGLLCGKVQGVAHGAGDLFPNVYKLVYFIQSVGPCGSKNDYI